MNKKIELLYSVLPIPLQNMAISIFGIHWFYRRYGGVFKDELKSCLKRTDNTYDQWIEYQISILRKLLIHCYRSVPYYTTLFNTCNLDEKDFLFFTLEDLSKLPCLGKSELREYGKTKLMSTMAEKNGRFYSSSGSTGTPTEIYYSLNMHQKYYAICEARMSYWAGVNYKIPRGVIGGRRIVPEGEGSPPYYRYNIVEKQTYFSAYHINSYTAANYLEGMIKNKVQYMNGYASSNYFLARFFEEYSYKAPKLKCIMTSSEKLTEEMRQTFYRVYGCKAFDSYNGVEATCLISECEYGSLHIVPDVGIVEILDKNGIPCKPGEVGEVVTTGLLNFNQPLIRYKMGDLVKLSRNQNCKCGRSMLIVDEIIGRVEDTVIGNDGREMVRFHGIFINLPEIIEAQIIQHDTLDFEIKIVSKKSLDESTLKIIKNRMNSQLGDINLVINIVDNIPRNANGKFKSVISKVKRKSIT